MYHQGMRLAFTVSHCSNCIRIHCDRNCIQSVSIRLVHMIFPVAENRDLLLVEATDHYFSENKQKLLKQKLLCRTHQWISSRLHMPVNWTCQLLLSYLSYDGIDILTFDRSFKLSGSKSNSLDLQDSFSWE